MDQRLRKPFNIRHFFPYSVRSSADQQTVTEWFASRELKYGGLFCPNRTDADYTLGNQYYLGAVGWSYYIKDPAVAMLFKLSLGGSL